MSTFLACLSGSSYVNLAYLSWSGIDAVGFHVGADEADERGGEGRVLDTDQLFQVLVRVDLLLDACERTSWLVNSVGSIGDSGSLILELRRQQQQERVEVRRQVAFALPDSAVGTAPFESSELMSAMIFPPKPLYPHLHGASARCCAALVAAPVLSSNSMRPLACRSPPRSFDPFRRSRPSPRVSALRRGGRSSGSSHRSRSPASCSARSRPRTSFCRSSSVSWRSARTVAVMRRPFGVSMRTSTRPRYAG